MVEQEPLQRELPYSLFHRENIIFQVQFSGGLKTWNFTENSLIFYIEGFVYMCISEYFQNHFHQGTFFSKIGMEYIDIYIYTYIF